MFKRYFFLPVILLILAVPASGIAEQAEDVMSCSEQDAQSLLSSFISYTDLRIRSVQRSLEILAATKQARSGNWQNIKDLLTSYQNSDEGLIVWYVLPEGTYYTVDKGLIDRTLSDRVYFPDLMAGKKITGTLVISKSTGQRSAIIAVPVMSDGKVTAAVGVSLFLDKLAEQIDTTLKLRPDVTFFALAPDGLTTLNRRVDRHFLDPRELGSESLKKAAIEMLSGTSGKTSYEFDNVTKNAIYQASALTQWKFAIAYSAVKK